MGTKDTLGDESLNEKTFKDAVKEAEDFLAAAKTLRAALDSGSRYMPWFGSPETAAVKRQSMELTRALANMRRAG
jgi:hypothetical protein